MRNEAKAAALHPEIHKDYHPQSEFQNQVYLPMQDEADVFFLSEAQIQLKLHCARSFSRYEVSSTM